MKDKDLKQLSYAYENYSEVFNRHFISLEEALKVETNALAGDDRAQVKLWMLYQDAKYDYSKQLKSYGQYQLNRVTVKKTNVVAIDVAAHFKKLAREAANVKAVDFAPSVNLGNRDPLAYYAIHNHGEDDFYDSDNLTFLKNPHFRYKGDIWWNELRKIDRSRDPYIYITKASKYTTPHEFLTFYKKTYSIVIPSLEVCAKSGCAIAAEELRRIYQEPSLPYSLNKFFFSNKSIGNPLFDSAQAEYWGKVHNFLSGQDEENLLEDFILSQDNTTEGKLNIGIALLTNQSIRVAYNKQMGISDNTSSYAKDLIKSAANMGNPNAAWFYADLAHNEAESHNQSEKLQEAIYWYHISDELGHPNAQHRYSFLTKKDKAIVMNSHQDPFHERITSVNMMDKQPSIFLSYTRVDKPFVRQLARDLERLGARVWLDEAELKLGDSLFAKISAGIDEMDYLAVVLSPDSVNSEWVKREVYSAMNQEIKGKRVKVLPLIYKKCDIPVFLQDKLYADFTTSEGYRAGLQLVADRLGLTLPEMDS